MTLDAQIMIARVMMCFAMGLLVGLGVAWLHPAQWMSAVALGCETTSIGLCIFGMSASLR